MALMHTVYTQSCWCYKTDFLSSASRIIQIWYPMRYKYKDVHIIPNCLQLTTKLPVNVVSSHLRGMFFNGFNTLLIYGSLLNHVRRIVSRIVISLSDMTSFHNKPRTLLIYLIGIETKWTPFLRLYFFSKNDCHLTPNFTKAFSSK